MTARRSRSAPDRWPHEACTLVPFRPRRPAVPVLLEVLLEPGMVTKRMTSESDSSGERIIPGSGPTMTVSTSPHSGTVKAVRNRVGKRGFSAYVEAALRRQIEQTTWPSWLMSTPAPSGTSPLRNSPPRERSCTVPRMLALGTLRDRHPRRTRSAWPPGYAIVAATARAAAAPTILLTCDPVDLTLLCGGKRPRRQVLTLQATGTAVCWPCRPAATRNLRRGETTTIRDVASLGQGRLSRSG